MMERISIFNYEVFYLDFLEGNLNEEDTALLMKFLDENPELKMEDETLPNIDVDFIPLDMESKNDLKQPAESDVITLANVEFFLISQAEGLLSVRKKEELDLFLKSNESLLKESALYGAVYFQPDLQITYSDKRGLKEKRPAALWMYSSIAAAASIIAFIMIWSSRNNVDIEGFGERLANDIEISPENTPPSDRKMATPQIPILISSGQYANSAAVNMEEQGGSNLQETGSLPEPNVLAEGFSNQKIELVDELKTRPVNILATIGENDREPLTPQIYTNDEAPQYNTGDYATTAFAEMENPIKPLTEIVEKTTNKKIDFRRQKKTEKKPGGFFLKIGKFELSRKKH